MARRKKCRMASTGDEITVLLRSAQNGDAQAAEQLLPAVYEQLRAIAAAQLQKTPPGQTLQPTALVHEAYLKIVGGGSSDWEGRQQFFFAATRAMHNILVDQARRKATVKHGGGRSRVDASNLTDAIAAPADDMLALSEALEALEREHPRQHQIVMLRFFGGLGVAEAAELVGIDERTARRDWLAARLTLLKHLRNDSDGPAGDG